MGAHGLGRSLTTHGPTFIGPAQPIRSSAMVYGFVGLLWRDAATALLLVQ